MIRIRRVGPRHWVTQADGDDRPLDNRFPRSAKKLISWCGLANGSVVATENRKLVGFCRWYSEDSENFSLSSGTWVDPKYRRQGLAKKMWALALKHIRGVVEIGTISNGGDALGRSVSERFPKKVEWKGWHHR